MTPCTHLFDSHAHLADGEGEGGWAALLDRARRAGVVRVLAVGGDAAMNRAATAAAAALPGEVSAALGLDRDQAAALAAQDGGVGVAMAALEPAIAAARAAGAHVAAIGEIGLDYHYTPATAEAQRALFRAQLALARRLLLPVVVHSREADADTLAALAEHRAAWGGAPDRIGVLHCFTGDAAFARALLALGLHVGFSGILTFRNAETLRRVAAEIPGERLLVETDTPYLAPVPYRGRPNEPAWVAHVAAALAAARGEEPDAIARQTCANAMRLFGRADAS